LSNLKGDNNSCSISNKYNALARLFWIKNNQRKFDEAFNYLNQNIQLINENLKKIDRADERRIFIKTKLALLKSNLGFHEEAITLLKEVIYTYPSINDVPENTNNNNLVANKASAYNILGESYFALNSINNNDKYLDSTLNNYEKAFLEAEKFIPKHQNSLSFYHLRIANVLIKRKQYKKALKLVNTFDLVKKSQDYYFLKSLIFKNLKRGDSSLYYSYKFLNFNNTSPNTEKNKIVVYNILANLYNDNSKIDSAFRYSKLALGMLEKLNKSKTEANKTHFLYDFNQIQKLNDSIIKNELKKRNNLVVLFTTFLISLIIIVVYFLKKIKNKKITTENVLPPKKDYSINIEIEEMVLKELKKFELSKDYLDSTFSIHQLAKNLNTNTSYLSSVINEKKGKTYKQYITELRINYLIKILTNNSKFRKYTVKALGEEIGYTNASSFSRSFKNYLGKTPSDYINSLKK
jgi:AraC-like DNA-binding protein/predicted negative regulator of RcsB-dependent stress response